MKINIAKLVAGSSNNETITGVYQNKLLLDRFADYSSQDDVHYDLSFFHEQFGAIRVRGTLRSTFGANCARCSKYMEHVIEVPVDILFLPQLDEVDMYNIHSHYTEEERDLAYWYEGFEIDLDDMIKDEFYLNLPIRAICSETCGTEEIVEMVSDYQAKDREDDTEMAKLLKQLLNDYDKKSPES